MSLRSSISASSLVKLLYRVYSYHISDLYNIYFRCFTRGDYLALAYVFLLR
nr:MAG TPA: hypothetical protein [Bacteriophage sp.]